MTTQGADTETFRNEAKASLEEVSDDFESTRLGASSAAAGSSVDTASLEHKMLAPQTRAEESLRRLEGISRDMREELRAGTARGTPALEEMRANISGPIAEATQHSNFVAGQATKRIHLMETELLKI